MFTELTESQEGAVLRFSVRPGSGFQGVENRRLSPVVPQLPPSLSPCLPRVLSSGLWSWGLRDGGGLQLQGAGGYWEVQGDLGWQGLARFWRAGEVRLSRAESSVSGPAGVWLSGQSSRPH